MVTTDAEVEVKEEVEVVLPKCPKCGKLLENVDVQHEGIDPYEWNEEKQLYENISNSLPDDHTKPCCGNCGAEITDDSIMEFLTEHEAY